jgi:hypothetical protein
MGESGSHVVNAASGGKRRWCSCSHSRR